MKKTTVILTLIAAAVVLGGFAGAAGAADGMILGGSYTIYVQSSPSGATATCHLADNQDTTPGALTILDRSGGIPNSFDVRFVKDGYQPYYYTVYADQFSPDRTLTIKAYLTPDQQDGYLSVSSSPSGAQVKVDGTIYGTTPLSSIQLEPGNHTVKLSKSGYSSYSTSVRIYEGQTSSINVTLDPIVSTGYLSVTTTPKYADVYVDNSYMGQSPITITVNEGKHEVRLQKAGYSTYTASVRVNAGQTSALSAVLSEAVTTGYVSIASSPAGAAVYIDGEYIGNTPTSSAGSISYLSAGPYSTSTYHTVVIKRDGYDTYSTSFLPQEKTTTTIYAVLTSAAPATAGLHVTSVPSGASVYVDNVYYGTTPATIPNLQAGSHTVKVSALGYNDAVNTITVTAGQSVELPVTLIPTSAPSTPAPVLGILAGLAAAGIFFAARRH